MDLAQYGWNWLDLFAMFGSEESVVEGCYHELNWLEDMSTLTENKRVRTGLDWLKCIGNDWQ